eukprot:COSAG04_NODE_203_length_20431_cov_12.598269_5_plen_114_part_00
MAQLRKRALATCLFGRDSECESYNHALRIYSAMYSHHSHRQEELNAIVVAIIFNELKAHKVTGEGRLRPRAKKGKAKLRLKGQLVQAASASTSCLGSGLRWRTRCRRAESAAK